MLQEAFKSEVAILKACRNRNIVGFLGEYVDTERTWLIMEYMEVGPPHVQHLTAHEPSQRAGAWRRRDMAVHTSTPSRAVPGWAVNEVAPNSLAPAAHAQQGLFADTATELAASAHQNRLSDRPVTCTRL